MESSLGLHARVVTPLQRPQHALLAAWEGPVPHAPAQAARRRRLPLAHQSSHQLCAG